MVDEGLLQGMRPTAAPEPLDREHVAPLALGGEKDARVHRATVEQHRADAALRLEAILLGAGQTEIDAEHIEERPVRLGHHLVALTVDGELERDPRHAASRMRSRQRASARGTIVSTRWAR